MRGIMKVTFLFMRFVVPFVAIFILGAIGYCQAINSSSDSPTLIISEQALLSWGVVLAMLGVTATAITNFVESRVHRANKDIHMTSGDLASKMAVYETKTDCRDTHLGIKSDFNTVHERLDKIQEIVQFIRAKLEDKK